MFVSAVGAVAALCDHRPIHIYAPFTNMTRTEIVLRGRELSVPFEHTWSCYEGDPHPCGKCGACTARAEGFANNGIPDPLLIPVGGVIPPVQG